MNEKHRNKIFEIISKLDKSDCIEDKISQLNRAYKFLEKTVNQEITESNYLEMRDKILEKVKYKVAIYGENLTNIKLIYEIVDEKKAKIIGIFDKIMEEKRIGDFVINPIEEVSKFDVDYFINIKDSVISETIISFYDYMNCFYDYEFYRAYFNYLEFEDKIDDIIIGNSTHEVGILSELFEEKVINMSISLQDIFYGKKICEIILERNKNKKINKIIIGMIPHIFMYDLSKHNRLQFSYRANMYYDLTKDLHNFPFKDDMVMSYNRFMEVGEKVFKKDYEKIIYEKTRVGNEAGSDYLRNKIYNRKSLSEIENIEEENNILNNYLLLNDEETKNENMKLMKDLLKLCKDNDIKAIMLVCPMTEVWIEMNKKYPETRAIFNNCIKELKKEFEFEIYDYFDREEFVDSDFYDASHLNFKGAEKFTKMFAADSGIGLKE